MTQFEYLAVAFSIVLGLAAARVLDALPSVLARDRRYWVHAVWTFVVLWGLANNWWVSWSYRAVPEWTAVSFFLVLTTAGIQYSLANLLVSRSPDTIASWSDHFETVRVRFFAMTTIWFIVIAVQAWVLVGLPWQHPLRIPQLAGAVLAIVGATSSSSRVQAGLAAFAVAMVSIMTATVMLRSSPLLEP